MTKEDRMTTAEYAEMHGLNIETVRRYIRSGKLRAVREGRNYYIIEDDNSLLIDDEIQQLTRLLEEKDARIVDLQAQTERQDNLLKEQVEQIAELHQLLAVSQKNIAQLTEQNHFLLEDMRTKRRWYHNLIWWKEEQRETFKAQTASQS